MFDKDIAVFMIIRLWALTAMTIWRKVSLFLPKPKPFLCRSRRWQCLICPQISLWPDITGLTKCMMSLWCDCGTAESAVLHLRHCLYNLLSLSNATEVDRMALSVCEKWLQCCAKFSMSWQLLWSTYGKTTFPVTAPPFLLSPIYHVCLPG